MAELVRKEALQMIAAAPAEGENRFAGFSHGGLELSKPCLANDILQDANLREADLSGSLLEEACLREADLTGAISARPRPPRWPVVGSWAA